MGELAIEVPRAEDTDALVALFRADVQDLNLRADDAQLTAVADVLLSQSPEHTYVRVGRMAAEPNPVGVIVAHRWPSVKFGGPAYWIETLFVAKAARRTGLGRALVEALISHARATGAQGIDLESYRMNAPASFLYRRLGFRRLGRERYSVRL